MIQLAQVRFTQQMVSSAVSLKLIMPPKMQQLNYKWFDTVFCRYSRKSAVQMSSTPSRPPPFNSRRQQTGDPSQ